MYPGDYQRVGSEMSFVTRQQQAQLRLQKIPWRRLFKTNARKAELEASAGTHFVSLLVTPEKWLLQDTIAIGAMLSVASSNTVLPECCQRFTPTMSS